MPNSSLASDLDSDSSRLSDTSSDPALLPHPRLRGLRWRVLLGILPAFPVSIQDLRRAAANGRRRYAELRRHLIVDPHAMEDVQKTDRLIVDNPLSQDPDSIWGRYFRNAELERTIENDLSRLYPEDGSFFQSFSCQSMLRRILLVWALTHPRYSYRQGMHEVLAPLLYVLHMDVIHLSQVRQRYEDPFENRFDAPIEEKFAFTHYKEGRQVAKGFSSHTALLASRETPINGDEDWVERVHPEDLALVEPDDFGFNLKTMVLGSDSYGAEGELGALLSGRFVEHDAYCMFDAALSGQGGAVVLADYFITGNEGGLVTGMSPLLEASAAVYHTLAVVDMPLYIHLVGLGIEPQFFALRWLRVLFSREFDLDKLLLLWDATFEAPNVAVVAEGNSNDSSDTNKGSPRRSFIASFAVSMLLYLRPTLLASSNATSCLQKLLNFPKNADVRIVIENAKVLQLLREETAMTLTSPVANFALIFDQSRGGKHNRGSRSPFQNHIPATKKALQRRHSCSPEMLGPSLPESYWEEKWKNSILPKVMPGEAYGVQNIEASANEMPKAPASSTTPVDHRGKQSMESDCLKVSSNALVMDVSEGFTSQKLPASLSKGAVSSASPDDRKGDALASRSGSLLGSPITVEASSKQQHDGAGRVGTLCSTISSLPCLDEEHLGSLSRDASVEVCSEGAGNDSPRSDGAETCFCASGENNEVLGGGSAQGTAVAIHSHYHCSPQQLCEGECPTYLPDRSNQNESSICGFQQKGREINKWAELPAICPDDAMKTDLGFHSNQKIVSIGNQGNVDLGADRGLDDSVDTVTIGKESGLTDALQKLGRSMVENIQVLECALSHKSSLTTEGASAASIEKSELLPNNFWNGRGHVTALSALAELRKISNILLQM